MVDDYGLIGGLGQGIQQGLLMYQKQKQLNRENQIQNLTSGVETDENGNLQLNAQAQQHKQAQAATDQNTIDENDINSETSKSATALYKQAQESIKPGSSQGIPDMTAAQVKNTGIPLAKPQMAGQVTLLKTDSNNQVKKDIADQGNQTKEDIADKGNHTRLGVAQLGAGQRQERLEQGAERIHNQNLQKVNTDPTATALINTSNSLQNAISNFQKGGATPQEFNELQQAVRSNTGIKGTSGVDERSGTYLRSLGIDADKAEQFLTGDPKSVMQSDPKFADQMVNLANLELANKKGQYAAQVNKLTAGHASFYDKHPNLKQDYGAAIQGGGTQMGLTASPQTPGLLSAPPQQQGLMQNGAAQDPKVSQYAQSNGLSYQDALKLLSSRGYKPSGQ